MDKSRSAQRTDIGNTVDTVNKSRSVSGNSLSNKSTRTEKPTYIDICKHSSNISVFSRHGEILSNVTPDQQHITRKNKIKKNSEL